MGKRKNSSKIAKEESESESESEEEPKKVTKRGRKADSDSDTESDEPPKKASKTSRKPAAKRGKKRDPSPSSEEESESESESSAPPKKKKPSGKKAAPKKGKQPEPDTDSDESESDSAPPKKKAAKKPAGKKAAPKKGKGKQPEPDSDTDESESESESSAPPKKTKKAAKPAGKKAAPKKGKKPESESEAESKSENESESESEPKSPSSAAGGAKGRAVDREVPGKGDYTVVEDWAVLLNQTNIKNNNNKFYIIQMLKSNSGNYSVWTRWGRVGESGDNMMLPGPTRAQAETAFKKKFKDKTKNNYPVQGKFVSHDGKYTIVETEEGGEGGDDEPLGKLSEKQINKGLDVLEQLKAVIEKGKKGSSEIERLSSLYYTLIPTAVGRTKAELINTEEKAAEKKGLLEFFLRMGFSGVEESKDINPIEGVLQEPLCKTLSEACKYLKAKVEPLETKGNWYAKKQAGDPIKHMEGRFYAALLLYTSNSIYGDMNKALRDQLKAQCKKYLPYLKMLFTASDHLKKHKRTLWRGIGVDLHKQYSVGSTITWWSVSSCTSEQSVAKGFMGSCGKNATLLTIKCKSAVDISAITLYPHEKENILCPGTQLRVLTNEKVKGVTHITLEEVGTALA